ncbi:Aminoacyl tRNA synthase complex-interacting multifunctional protein 1 [Gurleya vavrai]
MELNYSNDFSDYVFSFCYADPSLKFNKIDSGFFLTTETNNYVGLSSILSFFQKLTNNDYITLKTEKQLAEINKKPQKQLFKNTNYDFASINTLYFTDIYFFTKVYRAIKENINFNGKEIEIFNNLKKFVEKKIKIKQINQFDYLSIQAGKIIKIENHPDADKLYVETVLLKDKEINVVSGLRDFVEPKDLLNKTFLFLVNMKESKLRGVISQGMILCVKNENGIEVIAPFENTLEGSLVILENNDEGHEVIFEYKKALLDAKSEKFKILMKELTICNYFLCYQGKKLKINGKEICIKTKEGNVS